MSKKSIKKITTLVGALIALVLTYTQTDVLPPVLAPAHTEVSTTALYPVVKVVDGDTVTIDMDGNKTKLRLIGIDTPETVDPRKPVQCFGIEASNKAKELLSGKSVRIETDVTQGTFDKYGRLLAYVYTEDGTFFNQYMIEGGYAHEYTYNIPYRYHTEFNAAETTARTQEKGLWAPDTCSGNTK